MVDVDVLIGDSEGMQAVALRREVLPGGRDAGVSDGHDGNCTVSRTFAGQFRGTVC